MRVVGVIFLKKPRASPQSSQPYFHSGLGGGRKFQRPPQGLELRPQAHSKAPVNTDSEVVVETKPELKKFNWRPQSGFVGILRRMNIDQLLLWASQGIQLVSTEFFCPTS